MKELYKGEVVTLHVHICLPLGCFFFRMGGGCYKQGTCLPKIYILSNMVSTQFEHNLLSYVQIWYRIGVKMEKKLRTVKVHGRIVLLQSKLIYLMNSLRNKPFSAKILCNSTRASAHTCFVWFQLDWGMLRQRISFDCMG